MNNSEIAKLCQQLYDCKAREDQLTQARASDGLTDEQYAQQMQQSSMMALSCFMQLGMNLLINFNSIAQSLEEIAKASKPRDELLQVPDEAGQNQAAS